MIKRKQQTTATATATATAAGAAQNSNASLNESDKDHFSNVFENDRIFVNKLSESQREEEEKELWRSSTSSSSLAGAGGGGVSGSQQHSNAPNSSNNNWLLGPRKTAGGGGGHVHISSNMHTAPAAMYSSSSAIPPSGSAGSPQQNRKRLVLGALALFLLCSVASFILGLSRNDSDEAVQAAEAARRRRQERVAEAHAHMYRNGYEPLHTCFKLSPDRLHVFASQISFPDYNLETSSSSSTPMCEGYWRSVENPHSEKAAHSHAFPWPEKHSEMFCGQQQWLKMLNEIQQLALKEEQGLREQAQKKSSVEVVRQRGLSTSRLDGSYLGNIEYHDASTMADGSDAGAASSASSYLCWTGDFAGHYVETFNVVPSELFFRYVLRKHAALFGAPPQQPQLKQEAATGQTR